MMADVFYVTCMMIRILPHRVSLRDVSIVTYLYELSASIRYKTYYDEYSRKACPFSGAADAVTAPPTTDDTGAADAVTDGAVSYPCACISVHMSMFLLCLANVKRSEWFGSSLNL